MDQEKYCVCCGEDVPFHVIERNERRETLCSYCGFPLDVEPLWQGNGSGNSIAFVAEDSTSLRKTLGEILDQNQSVSKTVLCCNGAELLKEVASIYQEKYVEKKDLKLLFSIIDLNMPVMDGLTAARSIRALEQKNDLPPLPIIFFSSVIANDKIRSMMNTLSPAVYINKGKSSDTRDLIERLNTLFNYISEKYLDN